MGIFSIGPIRPGAYEVSAVHPAVTISDSTSVKLGSDISIRSDQLPRIKGFKIRGSVTEGEFNVENVKFFLNHGDEIVSVVTSAANGEFIFEDLPSGEYSITPSYVDIESGTVFTVMPTNQAVSVSPTSPLSHFSFAVTGLKLSGKSNF